MTNTPIASMPQWGATSSSMADNAYWAIKEKLVLLHIRPGAPISESELASELAVGRTPIREALKRLELDHLVVSYPRRGTFATHVDVAELSEITELRLALEPLAARTAALRATAAERGELVRLRDLVAETTSEFTSAHEDARGLLPAAMTEDLLRLDMAVHHGVYAACGNSHIADVLARYDYLATRLWALAIHQMPDLASHISDQSKVLEAIIERDADSAAELTAEHIRDFEASLRKAF